MTPTPPCPLDLCSGDGWLSPPARPCACLDVDVDGVITFACSRCDGAALNPVRNRDGRPFCSTLCRDAFARRVRREIEEVVGV